MVIGLMFVIHYQTKEKRKNNITCPITIFFFFFHMVMVLFWNEKIIKHLLLKNWKKHIFLMNFQPK
jgi:hypothetical protein